MTKVKKQKKFSDGAGINLTMLIVFILALVFVLIVGFIGDKNTSEPAPAELDWGSGWIMSDGTSLSLPCADKVNDSLTIRKVLPDNLTDKDCVVFSSGYQPIQVKIDGEKVPVVGTFEGSIVYATAYSRVPLTPEMSGKEMEVTFLNEGGKQWIEIYSIKLGNFNLIKQAAFSKDSIAVISGTLLLAVAVLIFVLGFLQRESAIKVMNHSTQNFVLASVVTAMFAIWTMVDTETVTLILGSNPAYVFVNIFAFLFIMGPWLIQVINTTGKHNIVLHILAISGLIETVIIIIGAFVGFFSFSAYLTASHLIGIGVESSILYLSFVACRQRKDIGSKLLFASSILLAVMSSIAAYTYYFKVSPNNVSFMKYGIFSYIFVMLLDLFFTFRNINQRYVSEVEAARQAAVEANRAKSDFLSSMSHDIRTPMNAIMGLTTIASANIDNKEAVKDSLRKISISSRHLLGLINDILDMSKIESGKISLTMAEISLREMMENLLNIIQPQLKSRGHRFDIVLENILSENVYCDGIRLNQVLLNLLSNAIKYTEEEGFIYVTVNQDSSPKGEKWVRTTFSVEDNGIGMTPEFVEHVFDSFTREDSYNVHSIEGSGLGMSITKHIVDMMEGDITVESRLCEGSTFTVVLDLERVTDREQNLILPEWNTLVVDDNEELCLSAVKTLKEMGIKAEFTLSGERAVKLVSDRSCGLQPYDIVLLDWQMPGIDGIETARRIRAQVGDDVPILLITAYDWSEIEQEAREAGINGFLSKPLFESTLRCGLMQYVGDDGEIAEPEKEERIDFAGKRILLAEDNDINWEIAQYILCEHGLIVDRAEDGAECLHMFETADIGYYDMILMDIRMPNMNGYQSAEAIRALQRADAAAIPIVAMTADAFNEDIQHCLEVGMNGHIAKPLDIKTLMRMIANYIK